MQKKYYPAPQNMVEQYVRTPDNTRVLPNADRFWPSDHFQSGQNEAKMGVHPIWISGHVMGPFDSYVRPCPFARTIVCIWWSGIYGSQNYWLITASVRYIFFLLRCIQITCISLASVFLNRRLHHDHDPSYSYTFLRWLLVCERNSLPSCQWHQWFLPFSLLKVHFIFGTPDLRVR